MPRNVRPISAVALFCLFMLFGFPSAQGASDGPAAENAALSDMVVTATRDAGTASDVPYSVSVLNADALRLQSPVRTVPEAMKALPGIMVQKTGQGQGSPYIRGFTAYRNVFLIDGIRLNNAVFRDGPNQYWNTVDPFGLSRMEIVRGPFSMLYGSDAVGGTVNAITRGVKDLTPGSRWDPGLYYRYAGAENSHIVRAETIGKPADNIGLSLGFTFKDFGDLEGGSDVGTQKKTGYDERDWDAKIEYFVNSDTYLVLAHQGVAVDDAWRTHKTIYGIDWEGLTVGNELRRVLDQERYLTYLQYHRHRPAGVVGEIHAGVSHHRQSEKRNRLRTGARRDVQGFDVDTFGAFVTLKSPSPVGRLVYGMEYYRDDVDSFNHSLNPDGSVKSTSIQGPVGDDASYDLFGMYLQDEIAVTRRLSLILGGRYEFAKADADRVEDPVSGNVISVSGDWDNLVGAARMQYHLNDSRTWHAFAGVSQGFRAPNLSDLTRLDTARTNEIETPTPDLDPESFVSYEVGVKAGTPLLTGQLVYFYTDIDDMIVRTPTGRVIDGNFEVTKKNAGDGFVHGIELDARLRLSRGLTVFGAYTWMDGEVDTYPTSNAVAVAEPIDRLMPPTGQVGLRWDQHDGKYWLEAACTFAGDADDLSTRDAADTSRIPPGGTPGYTVYDIRAGWTCTENVSLSLSMENISDEDFRVHGSGVNEPGRNVVLAGRLVF